MQQADNGPHQRRSQNAEPGVSGEIGGDHRNKRAHEHLSFQGDVDHPRALREHSAQRRKNQRHSQIEDPGQDRNTEDARQDIHLMPSFL